jgi:hypothetical protein
MEMTKADKNIGKEVVGYVVCEYFSEQAKKEISKVQKIISDKFGDAVWIAPIDSLHITLMDWLAPFVEYKKDKEGIFTEIFPEYDRVISECLLNKGAIDIIFNRIKVTDSAVIIIGEDNGKFNEIRKDFLDKIELIGDTKRPPQIIHSTICRFIKELPIAEVEDVLKGVEIEFKEVVGEFNLIRAKTSPMLDFSIVKIYKL